MTARQWARRAHLLRLFRAQYTPGSIAWAHFTAEIRACWWHLGA